MQMRSIRISHDASTTAHHSSPTTASSEPIRPQRTTMVRLWNIASVSLYLRRLAHLATHHRKIYGLVYWAIVVLLIVSLAGCSEFVMLSGKADPNIISMSQPMGGDVLEDLDKSGRLSVDEPEMASDLEQMSRKLIHEGQMTIKVRDVVSGRDELESMVDQAGGFVSNVQYNAYAYNRSIEITVRVPTDGFGDFL